MVNSLVSEFFARISLKLNVESNYARLSNILMTMQGKNKGQNNKEAHTPSSDRSAQAIKEGNKV
jgi:hypothetical protein